MTEILPIGALKNVWRTVWRICILGTLRLRMGASIEYVITEKSLARVRRRLRRKFGVKPLQYVLNLEDVKLALLILENCVILSHFIIHQRS